MDLRDFLRTYVDGYLVSDLRTMLAVRPAADHGALGYPIVASTFAGIELLGTLSFQSGAEVCLDNGRTYFRHFWQDWMYYGEADRSGLADVVYDLLRNGITHTFVGRPRIEVGRFSMTSNWHLKRKRGTEVLHVEADVLADDFMRAYQVFRLRIQDDQVFARHVNARFTEFVRLVRAKAEPHKARIRKAPDHDEQSPALPISTSSVRSVTSPSLEPIFTQLTTKGI